MNSARFSTLLCISLWAAAWFAIILVSRRGNNTSSQVVPTTLYQYNIKAKRSSEMLVLPPRQRCIELSGGRLAFKAA
jgi:hypothetical protein